MFEPFELPAHLNGPPDSANGGIACGEAAVRLGEDAEVTLRRPPPLRQLMTVVETEAGLEFHSRAGALIASARRVRLDLRVPPPVDRDRAQAAGERYAGFREHAFPTCFTCGPARRPDEALCLCPGPVTPGTKEPVACVWTPHAHSADPERTTHVQGRHLAAAIDCPGAWSIMPADEAVVLGRMHLALRARPRIGEPCVVMGWALGREGRKYYAGTSAHGEDGRLLALSRQTWIAINPS